MYLWTQCLLQTKDWCAHVIKGLINYRFTFIISCPSLLIKSRITQYTLIPHTNKKKRKKKPYEPHDDVNMWLFHFFPFYLQTLATESFTDNEVYLNFNILGWMARQLGWSLVNVIFLLEYNPHACSSIHVSASAIFFLKNNNSYLTKEACLIFTKSTILFTGYWGYNSNG